MPQLSHLSDHRKRERGSGLVEYAILVGLIALVATAGVLNLGKQIKYVFQDTSGYLATSGCGDYGASC